MRQQRWFPPAALAVGLFAINVAARLIIRLGFDGNDQAENRATIAMFAVIGLLLAGYTFVVCQRRRPLDWLPDVLAGGSAGMLLTVLVGPFVSGAQPFVNGASDFFFQITLYAACAIGGTLLGYWLAMMLGRDHRSRLLAAYAKPAVVKPRRVVRR